MDYTELNKEEMEVIIDTLELKPPHICHCCKEEVKPGKMCIMGPYENDSTTIILCDSEMCMSEFITEFDDRDDD